MVRQDERGRFVTGLSRARRAAFPAGAYVGQESFMTAGEIRLLAERAGVGAGVSVLDVCCGAAGPGWLITFEHGCRYVGVDYCESAVHIARGRTDGLPCRFTHAHVPPLPDGPFDVVLLLETMLAFRDKEALVAEVARVLPPGGRFAFTVEEGRPLTAYERADMPDAETVWLIEMAELTEILDRAGLQVTWKHRCSAAHHLAASSLLDAFRTDTAWITRHIGTKALADLVGAHELWCEWLGGGRVHKYAVVAQKRAIGR